MDSSNAKLIIGIVLLAIWTSLVILHGFFPAVNGADLIDNIKMALVGLGAYHIGDTAAQRAAPAEQQTVGRFMDQSAPQPATPQAPVATIQLQSTEAQIKPGVTP